MSITLPPLPSGVAATDRMREYATAYALTAVEADRASRVQFVPEALLRALRFYAHGEHFIIDPDTFDTVSGEPQNWLVQDDDGAVAGAMIEDGHVARGALRGADLKGLDEDGEEQQPIAGEVYHGIGVES